MRIVMSRHSQSKLNIIDFFGYGTVAFLLLLLNPTEGVSVFSTWFFLLPTLAILDKDELI